ncbi:MAG: sigma 54-interacting transcriptional regulator [Bacillota bacterium]|uniref:sigma-54-dependent transcriptional regulator n=1 Tax=Desulforudis sp. DRI-14 TaxID=3459793 RepID=UPI00348903C3
MSGIELLRRIRGSPAYQNIEVILLTGDRAAYKSVEILEAGAYGCLRKPVGVQEAQKAVELVVKYPGLRQESGLTRAECAGRVENAGCRTIGGGKICMFSGAMQKVVEQARQLHADRTIPVLIEGETGTGKDVVARYIHCGEDNVIAPFIELNCAVIAPESFEADLFGYAPGACNGALPKGKKGRLDLAQSGTLFLDHVGELHPAVQPKLLRMIEDKAFYRVGGLKKVKVDLRIVSTSNADLAGRVELGFFRLDLYYRLNAARIHLPPLRERSEEILPFARMFLAEFRAREKKTLYLIRRDARDLFCRTTGPAMSDS